MFFPSFGQALSWPAASVEGTERHASDGRLLFRGPREHILLLDLQA
ncbi:MAG: hypothetical protein AAFV53_36305 [Myxococcota bacterium]